MAEFRRGSQPRPGFEAANLPDADKLALCEALLEEFGATNIKRHGDELIHSCCLPFGLHRHGDANPSAQLNYRKLTYICHGCANGGGLLWFIGVCRGETSTEARQFLVKQYGSNAPKAVEDLITQLSRIYNPADPTEDVPIPRFSPEVLKPWRFIHPYLTEFRHVSAENVKRMKVGWDPERNRIVIPHFWRGDLVGWQSRRLTDDGTPKYQSTPDFPKSKTLYNHGNRLGAVIVVESPMSVVSKCHLAHLEATFGASVSDRQCRLIAQHKRVILFFDNDPAGWEATREVGERVSQYGPVWVADNPWAADPADLDTEAFDGCIKAALPYAVWSPPEELLPWETHP